MAGDLKLYHHPYKVRRKIQEVSKDFCMKRLVC